MDLKQFLAAGLVAGIIPMSAMSATVDYRLDGSIDDGGDGIFVGETVIDVGQSFETSGEFDFVAGFNSEWFEDDSGEFDVAGDELLFRIINKSDSLTRVGFVNGVVSQVDRSYGFSQGINVWFDGASIASGTGSLTFYDEFSLAKGESLLLRFDVGEVILGTDGTVNFEVYANPVPVPAAGFLLLGGLGGLAMMRRRKTS